MSYHSFLRKGSPAFFLPPFFPPLVRRLFLPTAIAAALGAQWVGGALDPLSRSTAP